MWAGQRCYFPFTDGSSTFTEPTCNGVGPQDDTCLDGHGWCSANTRFWAHLEQWGKAGPCTDLGEPLPTAVPAQRLGSGRCTGPQWHRFFIDDPCVDVTIQTWTPEKGSRVSIIVSVDAPNPTTGSNAWSWRSDKGELLIRHQDPLFRTGWYYVGVICQPNAARRTDTVPEVCPAIYNISFATRIGLFNS